MSDAGFDVDQLRRESLGFEVDSFKLVGEGCCGSLNLVETFALISGWRVHELLFFKLLFQLLFFLFEILYFAFVWLLELFEGVRGKSLCFKLLDNLVSIDNPSHLFEPSESVFVIVELLFLVVLVVFVGIAKSSCGLRVVESLLLVFVFVVRARARLALLRDVFVDFLLFVVEVLGAHLLDSDSALLEPFKFRVGSLLGMSRIVGQQQEFLEIVFLALQTRLYRSQLTVVAHSFFFQPFHYSLVSLLDALRLVVFYHDFIQPILQNPNIPHQWTLLNIPQLVALDLFQLVLQSKKRVFLLFCQMLLFIKQSS